MRDALVQGAFSPCENVVSKDQSVFSKKEEVVGVGQNDLFGDVRIYEPSAVDWGAIDSVLGISFEK